MANQSLIDYMDSLGSVKEFRPEPFLCPDSDTLTMYFQNMPSFAERIDHELTVFKSFDSKELIGFELKGILPRMNELARLIHVTASTPKIHIKLLLLIYLAEVKEHREPYEEIVQKSSAIDDARITVPG
jgi:hypothetical protein